MEQELQYLIRVLTEKQMRSTDLIARALLHHSPSDPLMLLLYELQDLQFCELRVILREFSGAEIEMLEKFDQLLHTHRLNVQLVISGIAIPPPEQSKP